MLTACLNLKKPSCVNASKASIGKCIDKSNWVTLPT